MKLADYLSSVNLSHEHFAGLIGVEQATVTRYVNGQRYPRPEILARIREVTSGQVTPNDFVGEGEIDDRCARKVA